MSMEQVLQGVIERLERIERCGYEVPESPVQAEAMIANMQVDARLAAAELLPLITESARSQRYLSITCARSRHRQCISTECGCFCHEATLSG
jgi:hypothetical protein